ncbi:penicillin-binding protein 1C [Klebsiella pneumoniae]|uniref:penicillin-binding protein 1C n=1 Tax=Klebsiella pneumoniae TaxID=573 RepID=UPI0008598005|nr:penicillin-binding protein 1C [Klebsiella pneumoniae]OEJ71542.1 penicillin-binding protein 1C [Klebsiella pneumoniae]
MRVLPRVKRRWRWLAAFIFLLWLAVLAADRLWPLPLHDVTPARVVVAEDGTPLWRFADAQGVWRYPVTLADVSPRYLQALIQYEDRWFWRHPGVNPFAVLRAAWQDLTSGRVISGGSTLTMQVARLLDPHPRTFGGKLRQLWRALQLEWHLSKSDILTLYLNRAPFGGTLQGIGAASWAYLGKPPASLSYGEAALLAVLPQAPSRLRPDRWPQRAQAARDKVLTRMVSQGVWPEQAVKEAMEEPVWLFPRQMPQLAPLFSRRALATSRDEKVVTTLDAGLQRQLEDLALNWKSRLPPRSSLAMVVVDHTDMKVRGWVGSADITDDSRFGHIDMVSAVRSPGSVLKPFIYAMAMDEGLIHPASLLQDVPRRFSDYRPGNFDSGFHGPVSASEALVRSLNLPAVQVLEAYGPKRFAANLRNAGLPLTLPAGAEPNLSLILGGAGARLEDIPSDPRPATVSQGTICWPGGQDLPAGDSNCRRRLASWLLDASQPPTLLLPGQESVRGIRFPVWRNEHGERVAADCPGARESQVEVWPLPLDPWLPASERRRARLGPASESCPPLQTQDTAPLVLSGIRDGAVIKRLPGEARVMLPLQTSGGEGRRWWFINGEPLEAAGARTTLTLDKPGEWQLVVMDEAGQTAAASFTLQ